MVTVTGAKTPAITAAIAAPIPARATPPLSMPSAFALPVLPCAKAVRLSPNKLEAPAIPRPAKPRAAPPFTRPPPVRAFIIAILAHANFMLVPMPISPLREPSITASSIFLATTVVITVPNALAKAGAKYSARPRPTVPIPCN